MATDLEPAVQRFVDDCGDASSAFDAVVLYLRKNTSLLGVRDPVGVFTSSLARAAEKLSSAAIAGPKPVALEVICSPSARKALDRALAKLDESGLSCVDAKKQLAYGVVSGTKCLNKSCQAVYRREASLTEQCVHHPGNPVFHEGLKFWSCCERTKYTDFGDFMSASGCTSGRHKFVEDEVDGEKPKLKIRWDFFQQGPNVTISVYAKNIDPSGCTVLLTPTLLHLEISSLDFPSRQTFAINCKLTGLVDVSRSKCEVMAPKFELLLRKTDLVHWSELGEMLEEIPSSFLSG